MIASDELNALREQINIVDVVAKYIPLTKKGHNYFAVCPFHGDTDPSMSVSEEKQMFHCFSCKASGNVFNFISLYENISYLEAVKKASEICHITTNFDYGSKVTINKNEKLYEIYDLARLFYKNNLNAEAGKRAKEYLNERGITDEIIKEFDIGVAFKNKHDLKTLLSKKYDVKDIDLSGRI
jgi:DNA primase